MLIRKFKEEHLILKSDNFGADFSRLECLPAFHKWDGREMIVRTVAANINYILDNWPDATWQDCAAIIRDNILDQNRMAKQIVAFKTAAVVRDGSGYKYFREPMEHQRRGFIVSRDRPTFALLMEQGTGKTKVIIDTACYLYQENKIDSLLIIAWPNGVHRNWIDYELPADCSIPYKAGYWTGNYAATYKTKEREALYGAPVRQLLKVFSFNIEAFVTPAARQFILRWLRRHRCLYVIDQSASIKNPSAERTKFIVNQTNALAPFRRILDGQPVAEGAEELYGQFKFLDENIIGHDTWTGFKNEFCVIHPKWRSIVGYRKLDELHKRIDGYCYRVTSDECLDLPERIYKKWSFDLSSKEQELYDKYRAKDLPEFDSKDSFDGLEISDDLPNELPLSEMLAIVKMLRMQQIASGWNPLDKTKLLESEPSRWLALQRLLEAAQGKALIFSRFRGDLEYLQKKLGGCAVSYHGKIGEEARATAKRKFMEDPATLYFLGQPKSAGIGHTLTAAKHVIFYANDYPLRLREECEKRAHRTGLKHKLIVWDLVARGTGDRKITDALRMKKVVACEILKEPFKFFLDYEND